MGRKKIHSEKRFLLSRSGVALKWLISGVLYRVIRGMHPLNASYDDLWARQYGTLPDPHTVPSYFPQEKPGTSMARRVNPLLL